MTVGVDWTGLDMQNIARFNRFLISKRKKNKHLGYIFVFCFHGQLSIHHHQRINVKNSSRVFGLSRNSPNIQLVIVLLLIFCTPRIIIHICLFNKKEKKEFIQNLVLDHNLRSFYNNTNTSRINRFGYCCSNLFS